MVHTLKQVKYMLLFSGYGFHFTFKLLEGKTKCNCKKTSENVPFLMIYLISICTMVSWTLANPIRIRAGSKYTFWDQIKIQLGQLRYIFPIQIHGSC